MARGDRPPDPAPRRESRWFDALSHELRAPLREAIESIEKLGRTRLRLRQRGLLGAARSSAAIVGSLLDALSALPEGEGGRPAPGRSIFNLGDLAVEVAAMMGSLASTRGVHLRCLIEPTLAARVEGDPVRLRQLLLYMTNLATRLAQGGAVSLRILHDSRTEHGFRIRCVAASESVCGARAPGGALELAGLRLHRPLVAAMGGEIGLDAPEGRGFALWFTAELLRAGTTCDERAPGRLATPSLVCSLGPVLDMSPAGMRVLTTRPPKRRPRVRFLLQGRPVRCRTEVRWRRTIQGRRQEVGLRFLSLSPAQMAAVHALASRGQGLRSVGGRPAAPGRSATS